jgi:hypothetical protein
MKAIAFYPEIAKIVGVEAALLFQQILYWAPKSKRPDGYFYKSSDEFQEETTLTEKKQRLCRTILVDKRWISAKKMMANGRMTWHYKPLVTVELAVIPTGERPVDQPAISPVDQPAKRPATTSQKASCTTSQNASSITGEYQESTQDMVPPTPLIPGIVLAEGRRKPPIPPAPLSPEARMDQVADIEFTAVSFGGLVMDYNSLMPEVQDCMKNPELAQEFIKVGIGLGLSKKVAIEEFQRFLLRWTEKSPKGRKYRWEMEKTFDVKRRLYTWFNNRATNFGRGVPEKRGMVVEGKRLKI